VPSPSTATEGVPPICLPILSPDSTVESPSTVAASQIGASP
jgi:hypothetical protein